MVDSSVTLAGLLIFMLLVHQRGNLWEAARGVALRIWLSRYSDVVRIWRVIGEMRRNHGRIDDGIWLTRRTFHTFTSINLLMVIWSVSDAILLMHNILLATPSLVFSALLQVYAYSESNGVVTLLRERKMWVTGQRWIDGD